MCLLRGSSQVRDRKTGKWVAVLRPTPDLLTTALPHRTQIIVGLTIISICG